MKTTLILSLASLTAGVAGCTTEDLRVAPAPAPIYPPQPPPAYARQETQTYDYTPRVGGYDEPQYREQAPPPPAGEEQYESPPAEEEIPKVESVKEFEEPLAEHGRWLDTSEYGRVWQPYDQPEDWRPYTDGHWEYTHYGWTWASYEPWGWACYHYGNWTYHPRCGWIWVPGVVWSPAWVVWRECDDYIAWAPAPPRHHFSFYASFSYCDPGVRFIDFAIVHRHHFRHRHCRDVIVSPAHNVKIINKTKNVTKTKIVNKDKSKTIVVNEGPQVAKIEAATKEKVRKAKVADVVKTPARFSHNDKTSKPRRIEEKAPKQASPDSEKPATKDKAKAIAVPSNSASVAPNQPAKQEKRYRQIETPDGKRADKERPMRSHAAPVPSSEPSYGKYKVPSAQSVPPSQAPPDYQDRKERRSAERDSKPPKQYRREASNPPAYAPPPSPPRKHKEQSAPAPQTDQPSRREMKRAEKSNADQSSPPRSYAPEPRQDRGDRDKSWKGQDRRERL